MRRGLSKLQFRGSEEFRPTDIPNLALWVDAADASTLTLDGSNNVSEWRDKSGNGRNFTQGTTSLMPSYVTGVLNGGPVVRPDGVDDFLQTATQAASVWYGSGTHQVTYITLMNYINTGRISMQLNTGIGANTNRIQVDRVGGSDGAADATFSAAGSSTFVTSAPLIGTSWTINTMRWTNGGTPTLRRATSAGTNTYNAIGTLTGTMADNQRDFVGGGAALPANFNLAEHMVFARALTDAEVTQIEAYLLAKWGTI